MTVFYTMSTLVRYLDVWPGDIVRTGYGVYRMNSLGQLYMVTRDHVERA